MFFKEIQGANVFNLGTTYNNLGGVYTLTGRNADARQAHLRALAIREKLAAEHPAVVDNQIYLAGSYVNVGELDVRDGQAQAALEAAVASRGGAIKLAKVDTEATPGLAQAFQIQSIPPDPPAVPSTNPAG
jgi:hypothetical protein